MTFGAGERASIRLNAPCAPMTGVSTSNITTSGFFAFASETASTPLAACPTTVTSSVVEFAR
jgi:hypothetical protein